MAIIYFRRATAVASIAACILAFAACDSSTRNLAVFALIFVMFILSVDVTEPDEATNEGQQATLDGDGRSFAEVADERESD
jgi:hypothetical protein